MIKKLFSTSRSFTVEREQHRRKSAIHFLPTNDDNKEFKRSIKKISKTSKDLEEIRTAIRTNEFISHIITDKTFEAILRTIYSQEVKAGETIIQEGEIGAQLFISARGKFQVITKNGTHFKFDDNRVFGELALLYNEKRGATVRAITKGKVWVLENKAFKEIIKQTEEEERKELLNFLQDVQILNTVPLDTLLFVADLLVSRFFSANEEIIKEGDIGDSFYIIRAGTVEVKTKREGIVAKLTKGQYFGELALINEDVRKATVQAQAPGCECLILSRVNFINHFGNVKDFRRISISDNLEDLNNNKKTEDYKNLTLDDFKRIKTIGAGGFGRVDLIQHKKDKNLVFALKYLKKYKCMVEEQREHVLNEKNVQINCCCPFIIRLFRTFKDSRYLYFLMEAQLGGDLWRMLYFKRAKPFDEVDAKFYVGCVMEAFQYLHDRGIVYRDLKPENLLISQNGYVKLTDFGFAKIIGTGKTHSMVGTPDYMPPEIVLNKSHDRAVDCWTLGIFIFELITLKTPFKTCCHHDTYNLILKGIEYVKFPHHISTKAKNLITKLCRRRPSDRLGYSKSGVRELRHDPWFSRFDWEKLEQLKMKAPYTPRVLGSLDISNLAVYREDLGEIPEDQSQWDEDF